MSLKRLGVDFEHYRVVEIDKYAVNAYNACHSTNFVPTDINLVKGSDLGIVDKDQYTYLLTYSYPCTSMSLAGKQEGMDRDSGTPSALLWQVERILQECNELGNLPDVLLMENVTECHNYKNIANFNEWVSFLEGLGYSNYLEDLNGSDFGVAQHRERAIMVSILGNYNFKFPNPIPLNRVMADYLEDEVDEKFYVKSQKAYDLIMKLVDNGTLPKDNALDRQTDRQTDRQRDRESALISPLMNHSPKTLPTAYKQELIEESVSEGQKEQALLKVGFIDKGSGEHQSNQVFHSKGISPTIPCVSYKEPLKVLDRNKEEYESDNNSL